MANEVFVGNAGGSCGNPQYAQAVVTYPPTVSCPESPAWAAQVAPTIAAIRAPLADCNFELTADNALIPYARFLALGPECLVDHLIASGEIPGLTSENVFTSTDIELANCLLTSNAVMGSLILTLTGGTFDPANFSRIPAWQVVYEFPDIFDACPKRFTSAVCNPCPEGGVVTYSNQFIAGLTAVLVIQIPAGASVDVTLCGCQFTAPAWAGCAAPFAAPLLTAPVPYCPTNQIAPNGQVVNGNGNPYVRNF